jgi:hypothetical protein
MMWNPDEIPNNVGESAVLSVGGMPYTVTLSANNPVIDTLGVNSPDASLVITNRVLTIVGGLVNNNSNVLVNAVVTSNSILRFRDTATATLSGSGTTTLSSNPINDLSASIGSTAFDDTVLTIGPLHTVTGTGAVTIPFENEGSMLADGGTLSLVPGFNEVATCSGQLQSTNAGILRLKNINLDLLNTGTALADGGDFEFDGQTQSQRLANGTITSANGGVFRSVEGNAEFENITLNGDAVGNTRRGYRLFGASFTNNGTVSLAGDGANGFTALGINATPYTIDGTGEVIFSNPPASNPGTYPSIGDNVGGGTLTNGANHTIRGSGRIAISTNNQGLINADVNGEFFSILNTLTNEGDIGATNGGTLLILSACNQTGAGLVNLDGGFLDFGANSPIASLTGGSVVASNGGKAVIQSGSVSMSNVTLDCDTDLLGRRIDAQAGMVNNGSMLLQLDGGNFGILRFDGPQAWNGTGEIVLNADSDGQLHYAQVSRVNAGEAVVHGASHTIRGSGEVIAAIDNLGLISADVPGRTLNLKLDDKANAGTIRADGGILLLDAITLDQTDSGNGTGLIEAINNGEIQLGGNGGATVIGGTIDAQGGVMRATTGSSRLQDLEFLGSFEIDTSHNELAGTITNNGLMHLNTLDSLLRVLSLDGSVVLDGNGTLRLGGLGDTLKAGVQPLNATATLDHETGHTIEGTGYFSFTDITNKGTFSPGENNNPGNEIGSIVVGNSSSFTCTAQSNVEIQIAGNNAGEFDSIADSGSAQSTFHCDGALNISNISGFSGLAPGDSLEIISSPGGRTGTFSSVTYPGQINYAIGYQPDGVLLIYNCLADVNHDGSVTPTDFTAWLDAFNNNLPECDQNGDGACTPTDFTAWIANFNAGC